jgi:hypothetical protein
VVATFEVGVVVQVVPDAQALSRVPVVASKISMNQRVGPTSERLRIGARSGFNRPAK